MKPTKFQQDTIKHVLDRFKNGIKRYLVADEVGLGKTIIAGEIIKELVKEKKEKNNGKLIVYYICSNERVSIQNKNKLNEQCEGIDTHNLRLSMQWSKINEYKNQKKGEVIIIPLSPATTFTNINSEKGNKDERDDMLEILKKLETYHKQKKTIDNKIFEDHDDEDLKNMLCKLVSGNINSSCQCTVGTFIKFMKENIHTQDTKTEKESFQFMRKCMNRFVALKLPPDLVVLDEFQNFTILFDDNNEYGYSLKELINKDNTKTLLLSATPYKMTSEDIDNCVFKDYVNSELDYRIKNYKEEVKHNHNSNDIEQDDNEQYGNPHANFDKLIEFVLNDQKKYEEYGKHKQNDDKTKLEEFLLSNAVCRTERVMTYSNKDNNQNIEEIKPYCDQDNNIASKNIEYIKKIRDCYKVENEHLYNTDQIISYLKLAPHFISFSTRYKALRHRKNDNEAAFLNLMKKNVKNSMNIERFEHFGFNFLNQHIIAEGIEKILWIPPVYFRFPKGLDYDFKSDNPFWDNRDYTKTLIFASYRMSTAACSGLISQNVSQLQTKICKLECGKPQVDSFRNKNENLCVKKCFATATSFSQDEEAIIRHYANLSDKLDYFIKRFVKNISGEDLQKLKSKLESIINNALSSIELIKRVTGIEDEELAKGKYYIMGSLNTVLEEYLYLLDMDFKKESNRKAYMNKLEIIASYYTKPTRIRFFDGNEEIKKEEKVEYPESQYLICGFCERFTKDNVDSNAHKKQHEQALQYVFNSPFYPFVLAATATAQEGLDFHLYSHSIVHYSIPKNPVEFEQREGRIDRYKSHLMRKRLKMLLEANGETIDSVECLYCMASKKPYVDEHRILFPFWNIDESDFERLGLEKPKDIAKMKRIVCVLPLSREWQFYKKLTTVLETYRVVFGPSYQENKKEEEKLNLSPYYKNKNNINH